MTIEQIQADEALRLREFPVARETAYLAHATVCPLPACARDAVSDYAAACTGGDQEDFVPANLLRDTRQLAANLIGAELREIALVGPTSLGLSFIAQGIDWQPGDNIIVHGDDYPSNVYPWMALAERGVELKRLEPSAPGRIEPEDVFALIDPRTRMTALASCHYVSGYRIDIGAIGRELRSRGILFCVDGIQTVGAFPTPVEHVDFLAADAHKWMLGPCSAGILYVKREMQDRLKPVVQGWHNLSCPDFIAQETLDYKPDARRYEAGTANLLGIVGPNGCGKSNGLAFERTESAANTFANVECERCDVDQVSEIGPARTSFRDDGAAIAVPDQDGVVKVEMIKRVSDVAGVMVQSSKRMD